MSSPEDPHSPAPPTRLERVLAALGRGLSRRPWTVLALLAISIVPSIWLASGLTVRSSFLDLLPPDRPAVRQLEDVLDRAQVTTPVSYTHLTLPTILLV